MQNSPSNNVDYERSQRLKTLETPVDTGGRVSKYFDEKGERTREPFPFREEDDEVLRKAIDAGPLQRQQKKYRDYSRDPNPDQRQERFGDLPTNSSNSKSRIRFPKLLYRMVNESSRNGSQSIISWCPHGRAFKIHRQFAFEHEVLPSYFATARYSSFARQLHLYQFYRIDKGPDAGAFFHEFFLRGRPDLLSVGIHRQPKQPSSRKQGRKTATSVGAKSPGVRYATRTWSVDLYRYLPCFDDEGDDLAVMPSHSHGMKSPVGPRTTSMDDTVVVDAQQHADGLERTTRDQTYAPSAILDALPSHRYEAADRAAISANTQESASNSPYSVSKSLFSQPIMMRNQYHSRHQPDIPFAGCNTSPAPLSAPSPFCPSSATTSVSSSLTNQQQTRTMRFMLYQDQETHASASSGTLPIFAKEAAFRDTTSSAVSLHLEDGKRQVALRFDTTMPLSMLDDEGASSLPRQHVRAAEDAKGQQKMVQTQSTRRAEDDRLLLASTTTNEADENAITTNGNSSPFDSQLERTVMFHQQQQQLQNAQRVEDPDDDDQELDFDIRGFPFDGPVRQSTMYHERYSVVSSTRFYHSQDPRSGGAVN